MRPIEVRFERDRNNLVLVREADSRRDWEYIMVALLGALFVVGLLFYGWQHYQYILYGYRIEEAQKRAVQLAQTRDVLKLDREQLRSPAHIDSVARGMLGMVPAAPGQMLTLNAPPSGGNEPLQLIAKKNDR